MNNNIMKSALNLSVIAFVLCMFIAPRLPFQDYADWIYQAKVFRELLQSNAEFTENFTIRAPVIPNSALTIIMGLMNFLVSPDLAGRIFSAVTFLLLFIGFKRVFGDSQVNRTLAGAFAAFFTPSIFFFYGYLSFNFGLALYLIFAAEPLSIKRSWVNTLIYSILFLLLYYIHFIVLVAAVITVLSMRVFYGSKKYLDMGSVAVALLPVTILFIIYLAKYSGELGSQTIWLYDVFGKLGAYYISLAVLYRFNDFASNTMMVIIVAINLLVMTALFLFIHFQLKGNYRESLKNAKMVIGIGFLLLALVMPYKIMGFGFKGDRPFWLGVIFICAAALTIGKKPSERLIKSITLTSLILLLARGAAMVIQGIDDKRFEDRIEHTIPADTRFSYLMTKFDYPEYYSESVGIRKPLLRICPNINTYHRVPLFIYADRNEVCRAIFRTGVLKFPELECDFRLIIRGIQKPKSEECRKLLFVSPGSFSDGLFNDLKDRFDIRGSGRGFIYATYKNGAFETNY